MLYRGLPLGTAVAPVYCMLVCAMERERDKGTKGLVLHRAVEGTEDSHAVFQFLQMSGALAAAADKKQRPDATCGGKNG